MPRGGHREGSGRKPPAGGIPRKRRSIRFSDLEWEKIFSLAKKKNFSSAAEYVRERTLEEVDASEKN